MSKIEDGGRHRPRRCRSREGHAVKHIIATLFALSLSACSGGADSNKEVILEVIKNCSTPVSAELTLSNYGSMEFKVVCPQLVINPFKEPGK